MNLAEPGASIGFTGARVIKQATYADLPQGFQTAEFQLSHGQTDLVVPRNELRETLAQLLRLFAGSRQERAQDDEEHKTAAQDQVLSVWQVVERSRHPDRPTPSTTSAGWRPTSSSCTATARAATTRRWSLDLAPGTGRRSAFSATRRDAHCRSGLRGTGA